MKNKILASLLAVCLFVGLAVPAFAVTSTTHNEENRVAKISFDKTQYNVGDVTTLDSLMTAYDKNGNRLMFDAGTTATDNGSGATQMFEVTYKSENESILKVGQDTAGEDVLLVVRNTDKDELVRITATSVTGHKAEVTIKVPKGTQKTLDYGATGYTVDSKDIYYLNDGLDATGTAVADDAVATVTFTVVVGNLISGKNIIKVGTKTITLDLTAGKFKDQAEFEAILAKNPIKVATGSGKPVVFNYLPATTVTLPTGVVKASEITAYDNDPALIAGTLVYAADTADSATGHELGTVTGLNGKDGVTATLNKDIIAAAVTPVFVNGITSTEGYLVLPIKNVGPDFTDAQLNSFKYKISTGTTDGFKEVTKDDFSELMANLAVARIDGQLSFVIDEAKLNAAILLSGGRESLIGKKAYVHVYNELFASAQTYKTATITIVGETAPTFAAYPSVINIGVGQNLDLRTIAAFKDIDKGYAIAPYVSQDAVEAHRIAKTLADTNYMVRGISQGTTTLVVKGTPIKLVVGPGQDYENDGYKNPSINPIVSLTVGAKYTIAVKDAGTLAPIFSSYDNKIATVDANGVVTAVAPGVIKIKVVTSPNTDARKDLYATVTVKAAPAVVDPTVPGTGTKPPATGVSFFAL